jgi:chromate transport protein ChrA
MKALALTFLQLGVTSVGGKSTQTYLFQEFVRRRGWLDGDDFAECYTLAKLLPGPTGANTAIAAAQVMRGPLRLITCSPAGICGPARAVSRNCKSAARRATGVRIPPPPH